MPKKVQNQTQTHTHTHICRPAAPFDQSNLKQFLFYYLIETLDLSECSLQTDTYPRHLTNKTDGASTDHYTCCVTIKMCTNHSTDI